MEERENAKDGAEENRPGFMQRVADFKKNSRLAEWEDQLMPGWVTPNMISGFRLVLCVPFVLLILAGDFWSALAMVLFMAWLDHLDGVRAHKRGMESELGAFLDPLADKAMTCSGLLALAPLVPYGIGWMLAGVVTAFALSLTALRVAKLAGVGKPEDGAGASPDIRARNIGKIKFITEMIALPTMLVGAGLGSMVVLWVGVGLVAVAAVLGVLSLRSHLPSTQK